MSSPKDARWIASGVIGSVIAVTAGLAPAAFADTADGGVRTASVPAPADVVLSLDDGRLSLGLRQDATDGAPAASAVDLEVGPDHRTTVPEGEGYGFLGEPGSAVWVLDGAGPGAPRWDTTGIPAGRLADDRVEWALTGVEGPGDVVVFEPAENRRPGVQASGPQLLFDSTDGLPDTSTLTAGDSGEVAWAFTRPGEYRITTRATARLATGKAASATTEWTVRVEDAALPSPAASGATPSPAPGEPSAPAGTSAVARPLIALAAAPASQATGGDIVSRKVVIEDGHVDAVAGRMVDGRLRTLFKDSRDPADVVWREPSSVVMHLGAQAKEKVPADSAYSFLGKAGSDFWLIPQVQKDGVVWAGWNTEALGGADLKGPVEMTLTEVEGPGPLVIWETAGLGGAQILYNSADGLPDAQKVNLGVHAHANWGFAKQGVYRVSFRLGGTLPSGKTTSDTGTYTFAVGAVDPDSVTPGGGGSTGGSGNGGGSNGGSTGGGTSDAGGGQGATSGPGGGGAGDSGSSAGSGSLAHTGAAAVVPLAAGAGALVIAGAAAVGAGRGRRRRTASAGTDIPS
ncbi:choice-of-anchor M domain-containing protein [Streptomyces nodosus]|uniref:choice-of-anchor M domain-containing protein n=1 Tax=Streptomyces nodosus TaxID=40318 RepID=UPI0036E3FF63